MRRLSEGDIVEWRHTENQDSVPYEVIRCDDGDGVKLLPLDGGPESCFSVDEIEQEYRAGRLVLCNENRESGVSDLHAFFMLPERDRNEARRRQDYVREMDDQSLDNGRLPNPLLDQILADVAARHCEERLPGYGTGAPSRPTARRLYARWRNAGRVIDALVPNHAARGSSEGRLHPTVEDATARVIQSEFLTLQRNSIAYCYKELTAAIEEINKYRAPDGQLRVPSRRAFARRIGDVDPFLRDAKRRGVEYARNKQRMVRRGQRQATRPNEIWQVDATCMDVMLVYEADGTVSWKRAYLTLIIDQFTRCVVGYYLSFEKPSFISIAAALRMALQPKDEVVSRYAGLNNDFPCWGAPSILICDNGRENHSEAFRYLCGILGIELLYVPRKSPQGKPHIERLLKTVNHASHRLPGTTFSSSKDKGSYDAKRHAGLAIEDLEEWLVRYIIDEYHQEMHSALLKSPYHMWVDSAKEEPIQIPSKVVEVEAFFMREKKNVLQKDGVHHDHLIYHSDELQSLFDHRKSQEITIRYSEEDLGLILVADRKERRWIKAYCQNMPQYAATRDRREHRAHVKHARKQGQARIDTFALARATTSNTQDMRKRAAKNRRKINKLKRQTGKSETSRELPATGILPSKRQVQTPLEVSRPDAGHDEWTSHSELPGTRNR